MRLSIRLISLLVLLLLLAIAVTTVLAYQIGIPQSAAGMAAKNVCSAMFIANRSGDEVIAHDIVPASVVLRLARINPDTDRRQVSASLPGTEDRYAIFRDELGCVTLAPGDLPPPDGVDRAPWPADEINTAQRLPRGNLMTADWPIGETPVALKSLIDATFEAPNATSTSPMTTDAAGPNTRAVVVILKGNLIAEKYGSGFDSQTTQLGWSMAKTMLSALTWSSCDVKAVHLKLRAA